ncbi:hypothetical protein [Paenibacillus dendritiformis]|uniref:hypothetical protein n=1 Tax=Paenibacillus dendritiformis TaxID=130049 RepID=UPI0020BE4DF6|nr:hypothetical protein [Paenibacillus dendritiformis]
MGPPRACTNSGYIEVHACPDVPIDIPDGEFIGKEAEPVLTFRWIDLDEVPDTVIYPAALKQWLRSNGDFRHIVNDDLKAYGREPRGRRTRGPSASL